MSERVEMLAVADKDMKLLAALAFLQTSGVAVPSRMPDGRFRWSLTPLGWKVLNELRLNEP